MQSLMRTCPKGMSARAPARAPKWRVCRAAPSTATSNGVVSDVIDSLDQAKVDELLRRFKMADTDGNGSIDKEELRMVLESTDGGDAVMFTEHWLPQDELDRIMEQYDKDGNGVIDFEEFKQIVFDGLLLDGALVEYEAAFKAVDSSGNGTIGATELAQLFSTMGNPMSYEKLVDFMQAYDKDGSGQIEFNEFLLLFRDQLLDLKAVQSYIGTLPADRVASNQVLDAPEGDMALIFSQKELDEVLAQKNKLVVLYSALTWCRPCKAMQRPAQKLAEHYKGTTTWVKLFGNANDQTKDMFKNRLKIRSTPCFIVFKDGEVVYTQTGSNKEKLEAGLREALKTAGMTLPEGMIYPSVEAV